MFKKGSNGRVYLDSSPPPPPFALFSSDRDQGGVQSASDVARGDATIRGTDATPVSSLFFSDVNLSAVQHGIRYRVWVETSGKHVISNQSEVELLAVMRSIYLQYSRNDPHNIVPQVRQLNAMVLDYCVGRIVSEIESYMQYRRDISSMPVPLEHGQLATTKGSRQLGMFTP